MRGPDELRFDFINKTKFKISKNLFERAFLASIKLLKISRPIFLELYMVSPTEIKKVNLKWRGKKSVTDVVSFEIINKHDPLDRSKIPSKKNAPCYLNPSFWGTIFLCPAYIKLACRTTNLAFKEYLLWAFIHGIIHCAGYDHEKSLAEKKLMKRFEKQILNKISF